MSSSSFSEGWQGSNLRELTDTAKDTPAEGETLVYNDTTKIWDYSPITLSLLTDFSVTLPSNGELLIYNSTSGKWENSANPSGAPTAATYLTSTANGTLTNEVDLGALSSGFLYGTVAAGTSTISSIATAAVTNGATTLATGDQIYDFIIGLGYLTTEVDGSTTNELPTAGSDIDVSGTEVAVESQLDGVSTITRASSNLTLSTSVSGHIILSPTGNVGIGTTAPSEKLEVNGNLSVGANDAYIGSYIFHTGDTDTAIRFLADEIEFIAGNLTLLDLKETTQDLITLGGAAIDVDINMNNQMFIEGSSGNVGIGTTLPGYTLAIKTGGNVGIGTTQWNSGDSINGTKVANADLGDIGVSSGVWSVEDSSHAHSAATITEADPLALLTAGTDNVKDTHIDWGTGASQVNPADFVNQDIGDITITTGSWAVENDSHDHSAAGSTVTINAADITDKNAGTDITADLEEETHASEHAVGGADSVFLADPNADRIWIWDDTDGAFVMGVIGTGLTYTAATNTLTASGGLANIVEDTTPQLGGTLDCQENNIDNLGDLLHDEGTASDFLIQNQDQDKDILLSVNDGGAQETVFQATGASGIVSMPQQAGCRVWLAADVDNLVDGTPTKINVSTETFDTQAEFDNVTNYRYTATVAGYYLIIAHVTFENTDMVADRAYFGIPYKNGAAQTNNYFHSSFTTWLTVEASIVISLAINDYVELYARQDSGGNTIDVNGADAALETTYLEVIKLF